MNEYHKLSVYFMGMIAGMFPQLVLEICQDFIAEHPGNFTPIADRLWGVAWCTLYGTSPETPGIRRRTQWPDCPRRRHNEESFN
jgi:hypothetical protein